MNKWKSAGYLLFIAVFFLASLAPLLCMGIDKPVEGLENRVPAPVPRFFETSPQDSASQGDKAEINADYFKELGAYFADRFAFRQQMVTADAKLNALLGESSKDSVIVGKDGWLYFSDTLPDYLGNDVLSDRQIHNIVTNLSLMREYASARGADFLFTVAPNKNSLYPEHMPNRYVPVTSESNLGKLVSALGDVPYADCYSALASSEETLYHATDSHWNNRGACLAYNTLLDALQKPHERYDGIRTHMEKCFEGDLETMLFPRAVQKREDVIYETDFHYRMTLGKDVESIRVGTENPGQEGSLVMYRDSFGNALLPFLAESYATALFSKSVPYDCGLIDAQQADTVIVEIAERNLPELQERTPNLPAPVRDLPNAFGDVPCLASFDLARDYTGSVRLSGAVADGVLDADSPIYCHVATSSGKICVEASLCTAPLAEEDSAYGFAAVLSGEIIPSGASYTVDILGKRAGQWVCVHTAQGVSE